MFIFYVKATEIITNEEDNCHEKKYNSSLNNIVN